MASPPNARDCGRLWRSSRSRRRQTRSWSGRWPVPSSTGSRWQPGLGSTLSLRRKPRGRIRRTRLSARRSPMRGSTRRTSCRAHMPTRPPSRAAPSSSSGRYEAGPPAWGATPRGQALLPDEQRPGASGAAPFPPGRASARASGTRPPRWASTSTTQNERRLAAGVETDALLRPRAPALVVSLARVPRIGHRGDLHPHLELFVALDGGLLRAAVLLAPDEREHIADVDVGIDDAQRERAALVEAVAAEHRQSHDLAAHRHCIERSGAVVRDRQVEELVALLARPEE